MTSVCVFENLSLELLTTLVVFLSYISWCAISNIYFHPLSKYPGPKHWSATRLSYVFSLWSGWLHTDVQNIHKHYGDIVRIAPDELSFARPEAWQDIYTNTPGCPHFPKSKLWHGAPSGRPSSILNALDSKVHSRMRKAMEPGFTEKALRTQEPIIQTHVRLLIAELDRLASPSSHGTVDIVQWIAFAIFDGIGDLGFGESFACLTSSGFRPWCTMIHASLRSATYRVSLGYYPALKWLLSLAIPQSVMKQGAEHWKLAGDKIDRRLNLETKRPDIVSMIKRDENGSDGLTDSEMRAAASVIIVAGSETSITVLSGTVNLLVKNQKKLAKLSTEVRNSFKSEDNICLSALRDLPYLNAVLNEGLRLCNPTPVGAPRIVPPGGGIVAGERLPEGIFVNVHALTVSRSPEYFFEPEVFHPERWLEKKDPKFALDQSKAIQPFGVGPRSCIGRLLGWAEMRLILARLLWRFDMLPLNTPAGQLEFDQQRTFTVVERQPFEIRLERRVSLQAID